MLMYKVSWNCGCGVSESFWVSYEGMLELLKRAAAHVTETGHQIEVHMEVSPKGNGQ